MIRASAFEDGFSFETEAGQARAFLDRVPEVSTELRSVSDALSAMKRSGQGTVYAGLLGAGVEEERAGDMVREPDTLIARSAEGEVDIAEQLTGVLQERELALYDVSTEWLGNERRLPSILMRHGVAAVALATAIEECMDPGGFRDNLGWCRYTKEVGAAKSVEVTRALGLDGRLPVSSLTAGFSYAFSSQPRTLEPQLAVVASRDAQHWVSSTVNARVGPDSSKRLIGLLEVWGVEVTGTRLGARPVRRHPQFLMSQIEAALRIAASD